MHTLFLMMALAGSDEPLGMPAEEVEKIALSYGTCAGVWDAMSELETARGNPHSAEQFHNVGNGAETTALWLLSVQHNESTTGTKRAMSYYRPLVAPRRESGRTYLLSIVEREDAEALQKEVGYCTELLNFQDETINSIRKQSLESE